MINSGIRNDEHLIRPFTVGLISTAKGYVHVLDDFTLDVILKELDAISDFATYLTRKEKLLTSEKLVIAPGEEELLAYYLTHANNGEHDFIFPNPINLVLMSEGLWAGVSTDLRYVFKKKVDKVSYLWDYLIENFHQHFLDGTLVEGSNLDVNDHEIGLRIMASEPRLSRRHLAYALGDVMKLAPQRERAARVVTSQQNPDVGYTFVITASDAGAYDEYRKRRRSLLWAYCLVTRLKNPKLRYVIGIASEPMSEPMQSYDLLVFDTSRWTPEFEAEAQLLNERGILKNATPTHHRVSEYSE
jgi:hypothetical protein